MRTSRVSRETAQLVNALSPSRSASTRRSARIANDTLEDESESVNGETTRDTTPSSLGKRKREPADACSTPLRSIETLVRRSPRTDPTSNELDTKRKARRQPAKHIKGPNGLHVEPPPNWEQVYNVTAAMRKRVLAPVDTMGCEALAEAHRSPEDQRLQTLVSLMLSSQTKDTVTAAAMENLQQNLLGGFNLEALLNVEPEELNSLIGKVGFHNQKTKYIKAVAVILRDQYNSDIPDTIEGLVSLPGVGPKMAYLCMSAAWGRDEGIGVDVHVHRITNLWGWHKTSTPEQTRAELEAWLPREKWHDINHLLVGFGQTICLPVGRRCGECDLATEKLCPSAEVKKLSPRKIKREFKVKLEDGDVVKKEEVVIKEDAVGVKVEADLENAGEVEIQAYLGDAQARQHVLDGMG